MTFVRAAFICAFLMLIVGALGARSVIAPYFARVGTAPAPQVAARVTRAPQRAVRTPVPPTKTPAPMVKTPVPAAPTAMAATSTPIPPTSVPPTAVPPRATLRPVTTGATRITRRVRGSQARGVRAAVRHVAYRRIRRRVIRRRLAIHVRPTPTAAPATATPAPTAVTGIVALTQYWVGTLHTRPGRTIAIGYVIDNETGQTERITLGASLKSRRSLSWAAAISDPWHDVVATVPPGTSTHVRYFTLPPGLRPGSYDVAWGLRNAVNGKRDALVFAPAVIRVSG